MLDLFDEQYQEAKEEWKQAKANYMKMLKMHEHTLEMLRQSHKTLNDSWIEFNKHQTAMLERARNLNVVNIRPVKKEEKDVKA